MVSNVCCTTHLNKCVLIVKQQNVTVKYKPK